MSSESAGAYPRDREAEVVLRDGSTVHVRPVRPDDKVAIREFLDDVSPESIGFRFFGAIDLALVTDWAVTVDYADRFALVAETGTPRRIIAHAVYIRIRPALPEGGTAGREPRGDRSSAEIAFLVADAWQGRGISTLLLAHLAAVAEQHGITTFWAMVLPSNHRMIDVFRDSGFPVEVRSTPDAIHVELPTSLSKRAVARFDERERLAAIAAVRHFLEPRSVAVIGASRRQDSVGGRILHNILASELNGAVYVVNEHADVVRSLPAYRSVADIPTQVELAVVVVRAERVVGVARECAAAGVPALLVISAGFAEMGEQGARRQHELLTVCRDAGIRIVGPNCLGVINTADSVRLNATFAPDPATPGRVGLMSQSGGLGIAIIEAAGRAGVGLSSFVSVGNRADLSSNDLLPYWEQDPDTDLALLYLESFGDPRRFARVAPRFARQKPLIAVKSGRSAAGARATSSHTGALLSASDVTVDALFEQAGVVRTETLQDMLDVAALLAAQPVPKGSRVVIITNAGGAGIMCADACQAGGVEVPELPAEVKSRLRKFLPAEASLGNPIDLIATASADDYRQTLRTVIDAGVCDAILAVFVPPLVTKAGDVAVAIREVASTLPGVPIAAVFMTGEAPPEQLSSGEVRVPGYEFPEDAARAVAVAAKYGRWRSRPQRPVSTLSGLRANEAAAIITSELAGGGGWLAPSSVASLLNCYCLPLIAARFASDSDQAVAAAADLGTPVALKAIAPGLLHKTDAGGVRLALDGPDAVRAAAGAIGAAVERAGYELDGLIVQSMAPAGVELIVGVVNDHTFGPVIACGAGGTTLELIKDVAVRITPLSDLDAHEMLRSLHTFPLLDGYRGTPPCDLASIEDTLLRLSAMVEAHPEIVELDFNPMIAAPDGAVIVDARIRVEAAPPPQPMSSLRA
ncbi:MAG TPA: GNAT family N-acetyltransferase [Solirubrobacteraceae bacterium]|nr:GNAT family N-acetyltransferase [Solirubrobacteraceae bacterium]